MIGFLADNYELYSEGKLFINFSWLSDHDIFTIKSEINEDGSVINNILIR